MQWDNFFKVLSDSTRLRILNLLDEAELNGNELMELLGIPQSTVSKHLKSLKDGHLIRERKEGTWRFYALEKEGLPHQAYKMLLEVFEEAPYQEQRHAVNEVLERRKLFSESYFRQNDQAQEGLGVLYSLEALIGALSFLLPKEAKVLDGGAGSGKLLELLSLNPMLSLYGLDRYYDEGINRQKGQLHITQGDLNQTGFAGDFFDVVFTNMVLHHVHKPENVFKEMKRILKPGGRWVIIDFAKHEEEEMRYQFKDYWLGFAEEEVLRYTHSMGLKMIAYQEMQIDGAKKNNLPNSCIMIIEKI